MYVLTEKGIHIRNQETDHVLGTYGVHETVSQVRAVDHQMISSQASLFRVKSPIPQRQPAKE